MEAWLEEDETVKFKVKVHFDEVTGQEEVTAAGVAFKNIGGEIYKKQSRGHWGPQSRKKKILKSE